MLGYFQLGCLPGVGSFFTLTREKKYKNIPASLQGLKTEPEEFETGPLGRLKRSSRRFYSFFVASTDEEVAPLNMIKSAPVGPVAGGIMGCIMVLVLAVYAYRHQIHRRSHQHMSPLAAQGRTCHYWIKNKKHYQKMYVRTLCSVKSSSAAMTDVCVMILYNMNCG